MKGAIIFTDIKGSSKLWKKYQNKMQSSLDKHFTIINNSIDDTFKISESYSTVYDFDTFRLINENVKIKNGLIIKNIGDALMIYFPEGKIHPLLRAIKAANNIQTIFKTNPVKIGKDKIEIRLGICYGSIDEKTVNVQNHDLIDIFGPTVNVASRMESVVSPVGGFAFSVLENDLTLNDKKEIQKLLEGKDVDLVYFTDGVKKDSEDWLELAKDKLNDQKETGTEFNKDITEIIDSEESKLLNKTKVRSERLVTIDDTIVMNSDRLKGVGELTSYIVK